MAEVNPTKFHIHDSIKIVGLGSDVGKLGVVIGVNALRHSYLIRLADGEIKEFFEGSLSSR
jgi:hypothetical protein